MHDVVTNGACGDPNGRLPACPPVRLPTPLPTGSDRSAPPAAATVLLPWHPETTHSPGDLAAVNQLLDKGVSPNVTDPDGLTALHRACTENCLNIASVLVAKGADIKAHDNDWWTPLHAAANTGTHDPSCGFGSR